MILILVFYWWSFQVLEAVYARSLLITPSATVSRIQRICKQYSLPVVLPHGLTVEDLMAKMSLDKKNDGGFIKVVAITEIGRHVMPTLSVDEPRMCLVLSDRVTASLPPPGKAAPYSGSVRVPGSKSISNRLLLLAALGEGSCRIRGLLHSDDTQVMLDAIRSLGAAKYEWTVGSDGKEPILVVQGCGGKLRPATEEIFLGNAGTASRFLTTVCTLPVAPGTFTRLTGVKRMKSRPIKDLVDSLEQVGCVIKYAETPGCLPIDVEATGLRGGDLTLDAATSSQFVSSVLLSAPYAQAPLRLTLKDKPVSEPYIEMTVQVMRMFGATVRVSGNGTVYEVDRKPYVNPPEVTVEADASSATYNEKQHKDLE